MITLTHIDDILDEQTNRLVLQPQDEVLSFTLTNLGDVDFTLGDNVTLVTGDVKTIGGSTLIPFVLSKPCKWGTQSGIKKVLIEKVCRVIIKDPITNKTAL